MFNLFARKGATNPSQVDPHPIEHRGIRALPANNPPTVITYRRDPVRVKAADPQTFGQYNVATHAELAPQPVPYTQYWNVGRDPAHAWPRMNLYQFMSPRDWLGVMQWPFTNVGHTQAGSLVYMPQGKFLPQIGRANINVPAQTSLGAQTAVRPPVVIDPNHAKLYF